MITIQIQVNYKRWIDTYNPLVSRLSEKRTITSFRVYRRCYQKRKTCCAIPAILGTVTSKRHVQTDNKPYTQPNTALNLPSRMRVNTGKSTCIMCSMGKQSRRGDKMRDLTNLLFYVKAIDVDHFIWKLIISIIHKKVN